MFLRANKRYKDGKVHRYWSLMESVRAGRRVFQRQVLYLGELNDSQESEWQHAVEAFDEKGRARQLRLFPEDRAPANGDGQVVRIRMDALEVRNLRNWGEVWLGLELWEMLGLDRFWESRLPPSRFPFLLLVLLCRKITPGEQGRCRVRPRRQASAEGRTLANLGR